jgi:hypothetical protein
VGCRRSLPNARRSEMARVLMKIEHLGRLSPAASEVAYAVAPFGANCGPFPRDTMSLLSSGR